MSNTTRILIALVSGIVLGIIGSATAPATASILADIADPVGALWLNGLKMTIVPLVVALLITGIAQTAEAARSGPMAARTLGWIVGLMSLSAILGAILTPAFLAMFPIPGDAASSLRDALGVKEAAGPVPSFAEIVTKIVPANPIAAAATTDILPLMVFALALAFAITKLDPGPRQSLTDVFAALADALVIVIGWVLRLAPIGVFALAFVVSARSGTAALQGLLHYIVIVSAVGIVVGLLAYPIATIWGRTPLALFARGVAPVQALAISTQSSLACLPLMLAKSQELGAREPTAGLVLPMAVALMRITGPAMNLAVALYVAHWFGVALGPVQYGTAIVIAVLTSMGAVSLPGQASFFTSCAPICIAIGAPIEALGLLVTVETLPDIFRTLGNAQADVALTLAVEAQSKEQPDENPQTGLA
jgi:proton glutamate symport protein